MNKRKKFFYFSMDFIMFFIAFIIGYHLEIPKIYSLIISAFIYFFELACVKIVKKIIFMFLKHHKKLD